MCIVVVDYFVDGMYVFEFEYDGFGSVGWCGYVVDEMVVFG